jgi:predicted PurR-regulated permease PerM
MNNKNKEYSDNNRSIDNAIRIGLITLLAAWCLYIATPFIAPVLWGVIIAIGSYDFYKWIQKKLALSNGWSATLFTTLMLVVLITPTIILSNALMSEAHIISQDLKKGALVIPPPPKTVSNIPIIGNNLSTFWVKASEDPKSTLGELEPQVKKFVRWSVKAAGGAAVSILMLIFSIIIAGIFLASAKEGRQVSEKIFSRLVGGRGKEMTDLSLHTITSVVNGILGIAIIQTLLAGMGFMVMDIPGAGALAMICLVFAIIQIDILIILIPLSLYMFNVVDTGPAIVFLIWNIIVGLMNNILKPILLARGVEAPMAIIFIGAIGGLIAHGIIGLFIGSVVFVLGYTLFMFWINQENNSFIKDKQ